MHIMKKYTEHGRQTLYIRLLKTALEMDPVPDNLLNCAVMAYAKLEPIAVSDLIGKHKTGINLLTVQHLDRLGSTLDPERGFQQGHKVADGPPEGDLRNKAPGDKFFALSTWSFTTRQRGSTLFTSRSVERVHPQNQGEGGPVENCLLLG